MQVALGDVECSRRRDRLCVTAYVDATNGESVLVFHALKMTENGAPYLWVKQISWQNDWPVLM